MKYRIIFYQDFGLLASFQFILPKDYQQLKQPHFVYNFMRVLLKLPIKLMESMNLCSHIIRYRKSIHLVFNKQEMITFLISLCKDQETHDQDIESYNLQYIQYMREVVLLIFLNFLLPSQ